MTTVHLVREVKLPPELHAAAATNRLELVKTLTRKLSKEEQASVVDALAVYIETCYNLHVDNESLRLRLSSLRLDSKEVSKKIRLLANELDGVCKKSKKEKENG